MTTRTTEVSDQAIVLRTYKSGEADRISSVWTKEHGKLRVLARGSRKPSSRLGGTLETLGFVKLNLVKSKGDLWVVRNVSHVDPLLTLRSDYERITAGYAIVEAIDAIPSEDVADEGVFELARRVLVTLNDPAFNPQLVPASFYFKLLAYDGTEPVVDVCASCGSSGPLVAFSIEQGGVLCSACRVGSSLSPAALDLIRRILGGDLATVLKEAEAPAAGEVSGLAQEAIESHLARRLKVLRTAAPLAKAIDA
jgi:DNA repair protein RecO (recombination protein O)